MPSRKQSTWTEASDADVEPAAKRIKPSLSTTATIHRQLQERYSVHLSEHQFVGLCGYLCSILRAGFSATTADLDQFVVCYRQYEAALPALQQSQINTDTVQIPSYHVWFRERAVQTTVLDPHMTSTLNATQLREIWQENPLTFLRADEALKRIAEKVHRGATSGETKKSRSTRGMELLGMALKIQDSKKKAH